MLEPRHKEIVLQILRHYPYTFYVYGSRAKGTAKRFSDLDLCIMEPVDELIAARIKEQFEESNLPFTVDITRWEKCSEEFKKNIKDDLLLIE